MRLVVRRAVPGPVFGGLLGAALASVVCLGLTACTSGRGTAPERTAAASRPAGVDAVHERKLTAQARAALDAVAGQDGSLVESGVERVVDGVHTQPLLSTGRPYRLAVACAGEGTAEIVFSPGGAAAKRAVPCDRSVVSERFSGDEALRIDVRAGSRASGMIAWRIDAGR
ncbi:hypothetical protein AB0E62_00795 [Streptomyces sp. NPDC038707]|uniref:hypothetical protein n=1 Tax=Streptomyces sp. NPDC038707 TaxID=3154329 RepID=UPI00340E1D96